MSTFTTRKTKKCFCYNPRRCMKAMALVSLVLLVGGGVLLSLPPAPLTAPAPGHPLYHYWKNRDLHTYIDPVVSLMEPAEVRCGGGGGGGGEGGGRGGAEVVALVTSAPGSAARRQAIRDTYAQHIPTFFFLGVDDTLHTQLVDNYAESKQHQDMVVFDFVDAYTNLTLKTALMLRWSARHCAHAQFVLKTDDDVIVNPWTMKELVKQHQHEKVIGYRHTGDSPFRNPNKKWYLPRWLYPRDDIPEYLEGTGYLINVAYLSDISEAAYSVPLINLEDVYFTLLVAKQKLGYKLSDDRRLSPAQPLFPFACAYWHYASMHSLGPAAVRAVWSKIAALGLQYDQGNKVCTFYNRYFSVFSSYALSYRGRPLFT